MNDGVAKIFRALLARMMGMAFLENSHNGATRDMSGKPIASPIKLRSFQDSSRCFPLIVFGYSKKLTRSMLLFTPDSRSSSLD